MSPRKAALTPAKKTALDWVKGNEPWLSKTHTEIWNFHEPAWREYRSAAYYVKLLREQGFEVEEGTATMPTAFLRHLEERQGGPAIASYAEYDAVPGNSQDPVPYEKPRDGVHKYAAGHTDPHSALGIGALGGLLGGQGGDGEARHSRHAQVLRRAGGEGVRLEAGARRPRLLRRSRRRHQLPPRLFPQLCQHDHLGHPLRRLLEQDVHLRMPASGDLGGAWAPATAPTRIPRRARPARSTPSA